MYVVEYHTPHERTATLALTTDRADALTYMDTMAGHLRPGEAVAVVYMPGHWLIGARAAH